MGEPKIVDIKKLSTDEIVTILMGKVALLEVEMKGIKHQLVEIFNKLPGGKSK